MSAKNSKNNNEIDIFGKDFSLLSDVEETTNEDNKEAGGALIGSPEWLENRKQFLARLAQEYYEGTPEVEDFEFDLLQKEYIEKGGEETLGHGFKPEDNRKIKHEVVMGSLKKIKDNRKAMLLWFASVKDIYENLDSENELTFSVSPKFDGLAVSVLVENRKVKTIATRGDGVYGENVTATAMNIPDIKNFDGSKDGCYYGEVMLPKENLAKANELRDPKEQPLNQVRNAAAGIVRRLEDKNKVASTLVFANHNSGDYVQTFTYDEIVEKIDDVLADFKPLRANYPISDNEHVFIDGVVFKCENVDVREEMGYSSGSPKWARAWKFKDEIYTSKIDGIIWMPPGKIGRITPVLSYDTIMINGGKYNRATLHNLTNYLNVIPRIGDSVSMIKSGDVIPYVVDVTHTEEVEDTSDVVLSFFTGEEAIGEDGIELVGGKNKLIEAGVPAACPTCGADTVVDGEFLLCSNDRVQCNPAAALTLVFTSFGIKGLQEKIISKIYDALNLGEEDNTYDSLARLYRVVINDPGCFDGVEGLGSKTEDFVRETLVSLWSGEGTLAQWIRGLNVERVGKSTSVAIEQTYGSLDELLRAIDDYEGFYREVQHLKGVNWDYICRHRDRFVLLNNFMKNNDIKVKKVSSDAVVDPFWNGKVVALTGSLGISRSVVEEWLTSRGAYVGSGFDILIDAGDGSSSKSKKARDKGKEVMLGTDFLTNYYYPSS